MTWIITIFSLIGAVLNIKKSKWCFYVWAVTNSSWMIVDFVYGLYAQSALFFVYFCLAIWGIIEWEPLIKQND